MYQDNETYEREGEIIVIVLYRSIDSNLRIRISLRGNSIIFCTHNKIKPLPTIESQRLSNYSQIDHFLFILSLSLLITLSIFAFQLPLSQMTVSQSLCRLFTPHMIIHLQHEHWSIDHDRVSFQHHHVINSFVSTPHLRYTLYIVYGSILVVRILVNRL